MVLITTHTNADFDSFASMVAARKLYPGATVAFSGSAEKALREALDSVELPFEVLKPSEVDPGEVDLLVLVDVRSPSRIDRFAPLVEKGIEVHVYDHHPPTEGEIRGKVDVVRPYGATTTVLVHIIKEKGLEITPREATIFMAGIYEDTGSLSYPSTTVSDYEAAAHLLECGADLTEVTDLLRKELSGREVSLLSDFLSSETTYTVGGVEVVVAEGYLEKNIGDISTLAHKIQDLEGMDVLFVLVDSVDRVHFIARSRVDEVDVGKVCRGLGGGGHANAASATVKGITLIQARDRLIEALRAEATPARTAPDIMSYPALTAPVEMTLERAMEVMLRYGINAMPVTDDGKVLGVITRQVADKAVYHGLGSAPAADYMTTEFATVPHDASIDEIREKVIYHGQRLLPVVREGRIAGVITRTDLLKLFQEELREEPPGVEGGRGRNLANLMAESMPEWALEILRDAGHVAEEIGCRAYVVGGIVRDLILRRENLDIDIVIERGDGIEFAREFAGRKGLRSRAHERFKTAVVVFPDDFKVDVATARLEYYEKPGALPTVEKSSLKLDLYRRDFIMNTLAVALNPDRFGELVDFFGAQKDLKDKTIRVIHNLSFVEDPTRAFRAVRFSVKFGFRIGAHTLNLMKNALKHHLFDHISGARLLDELRHILDEEMAGKAVARLQELGLLELVHEKIEWDEPSESLFERAHESVAWHRLLYTEEETEDWLVMLLALADPLDEDDLRELAARLNIEGKRRLRVIEGREAGLKALSRVADKKGRVTASRLYHLLDPLPLEVILYLMARAGDEDVKKALSAYITRLRYTSTELDGNDLKAMGAPEGPLMGRVLGELLDLRLDGVVETREEEEEHVRKRLVNQVPET